MAMAHKPPPPNYKRSFWIARHARERLRERLSSDYTNGNGNGTEHLDDQALNNLIDSLVCNAFEAKKCEDIVDDGTPAQLVDLRDDLPGGDLWALIKDNNHRRARANYERAVVTLLLTHMVERSRRSGKWEYEKYDDSDVSIGGLSDSAKEVLRKIPVSKNSNVEEKEGPIPVDAPTPALLILYETAQDHSSNFEECDSLEVAKRRLNEIRNDSRYSNDSIRVFREVRTLAKIIL